VYSDPFGAPLVIRGLFAELGKTVEKDQYVVVGYDGEFSNSSGFFVIAGTDYAEDRASLYLKAEMESGTLTLSHALSAAVYAWGLGRKHIEEEDRADGELPKDREQTGDVSSFITEHLKGAWTVEAAILERNTHRESRYRTLTDAELEETLAKYS